MDLESKSPSRLVAATWRLFNLVANTFTFHARKLSLWVLTSLSLKTRTVFSDNALQRLKLKSQATKTQIESLLFSSDIARWEQRCPKKARFSGHDFLVQSSAKSDLLCFLLAVFFHSAAFTFWLLFGDPSSLYPTGTFLIFYYWPTGRKSNWELTDRETDRPCWEKCLLSHCS